MHRILFALIVLVPLTMARGQCGESEVRNVVISFERALSQRSLSQVGQLVSPDIVVFENGHRNDGWVDFRDHHLKPEFEEPAPQIKSEIVKIATSGEMAWAYSRGTFTSKASDAEHSYELWSVYVLSKQDS